MKTTITYGRIQKKSQNLPSLTAFLTIKNIFYIECLKTISILDFSRHKIIEERKEYLEKLNIHRENEEKRKAAEALAEQQKLEEVQYYFPSKRNRTLQIYFSQELN